MSNDEALTTLLRALDAIATAPMTAQEPLSTPGPVTRLPPP